MPDDIFSIAHRHADWLAQRRLVLAGNVAHANTPGYRAQDVQPFEQAMADAGLGLIRSDPRHLASAAGSEPREIEAADGSVQHSGNSVDIEQEMLKTGEVSRAHQLNVSVVRTFHRMSLLGVKG